MVRQDLALDTLSRLAIEHLPQGVYLINREGTLLIWNGAAERMTGYRKEELEGPNQAVLSLHYSERGVPLNQSTSPVSASLQDGQERTAEVLLRCKNGQQIPVRLHSIPIAECGETVAVMVVLADQSNAAAQPSAQAAGRTSPAGFPDQQQSKKLLHTRLVEFGSYRSDFCVLFANLDFFSRINSEYGYEAGNCILDALEEQMRLQIQSPNWVGRWSGEEFLFVFEGHTAQELRDTAEALRNLVQTTTAEYKGHTLQVTASIGGTMATAKDTAQELIERTISLMYVSKISGRNCCTIG